MHFFFLFSCHSSVWNNQMMGWRFSSHMELGLHTLGHQTGRFKPRLPMATVKIPTCPRLPAFTLAVPPRINKLLCLQPLFVGSMLLPPEKVNPEDMDSLLALETMET